MTCHLPDASVTIGMSYSPIVSSTLLDAFGATHDKPAGTGGRMTFGLVLDRANDPTAML